MIKFLLLILISLGSFSKKQMPVNNDFINFENIKGVLKKDQLEKTLTEKQKRAQIQKQKKKSKQMKLYGLPTQDDFWKIMIEHWLVKNITILKWDFRKPDYGVDEYFTNFLRQTGEIGLKFNILYLNTPNISHFAFPMGSNEYLFLVSVPFIKSLDLSKLEISIMLLEDLLRVKNDYFINSFDSKLTSSLSGGSFYQKEFPSKNLKTLMTKIDEKVFEKGFSFQEQHKITKMMNNILISDTQNWQAYYRMLSKIDELVKGNLMYKNYLKIYPSPELQMNWLNPTKN